MGMFTLVAVLDELDGGPSTGTFIIEPNTLLPGKVWDRYVAATAVDGILSVELPAADVKPEPFAYNVRRIVGGGRWVVPAQDPGAIADLSDYRVPPGGTSPVLPQPPDLAAQVAALVEVVADLAARLAALEAGITPDAHPSPTTYPGVNLYPIGA